MATPGTPTGDGSFWTFTLELYGKPGVAPALIGLQDRLGLDVNMLLYCCWVGADGRRLSREDLKAVEAVAESWQSEVVRPLRALRRRLKGGFPPMPADRVESYRKRVNELEIEGEHIVQNAMAKETRGERQAGTDTAAAAVCANLQAYLKLRHAPVEVPERADLTTILRACCPGDPSACFA
jgi:uncharacterized protein (TIGR02444 family)